MRYLLQAGMPKKGKMLALAGSRRGGKLEICRNLIVSGKRQTKCWVRSTLANTL